MEFSMKSLQINAALGLVMKTTPLLLVRFGALVAFWFAALIYLGVTIGVSLLVGQAIPLVGFILAIIAIAGIAPIYQLFYRYVFYMIKAAHIAVVSELLYAGKLPDGVNQLEWGRQRVTERFGEVNVMFVVDELVAAVIKAFTNTVYSFSRILPGDTFRNLAQVAGRIAQFALSYIDEAVLARSFWNKDDNVWANARDGLTLYAMAWKPLLVNAIALMVISYVPFLFAFFILALPIGLIANAVFGGGAGGWAIIATLLLAYLVKVAVGDAFAMSAILISYQKETDGLTPNPEMTSKLEMVSDKFKEIESKARDEFRKHTEAGTPLNRMGTGAANAPDGAAPPTNTPASPLNTGDVPTPAEGIRPPKPDSPDNTDR